MCRKVSLLVAVILAIGGLTCFILLFQWPGERGPIVTVAGGNMQRGHRVIVEYGCSGCHTLAAVRQATGRVGPKLEDLGEQVYLAGVLPNQPENMVMWLMNPRELSPQTAMPDLDVTEQDARDIGAFLYMGK